MKTPKATWAVLILACAAMVVGYVITKTFSGSRPKFRRANCLSNLLQIGIALRMYAEQHGGQLPPESGAKGLDSLLRENLLAGTNVPKLFVCPEDKTRHAAQLGDPLTEENCSYVYVPTAWRSGTETKEVPVYWDKPGNHIQGLVVLFNDGHVAFVTPERGNAIRLRAQSDGAPLP